jgi:dTDP-glucose 4,6-dehydratase/UDP-glucose 4-epimerase
MKYLEGVSMKPTLFRYDISEDIQSILDRLGQDINAFNHKTILITGGTGFFGRWLLQVLCTLISDKNFQIKIFVLSRNPNKFLMENSDFPFARFINFLEGDVNSFRLPKFKLDYLIHMATTAAYETFSGEDQLSKFELLYFGTKNTLENAIANGVQRVLFTSSGVAYGPSKGELLSEDMLQAPSTTLSSSALGEGKRVAEFLVAYYAQKADYQFSIARCFSFFGPYLPLDIHYALGNFVRDALINPEIVVNGSGQEMRSYLYIADAWVWMLKMLVESDGETYNVGSSEAISICDLACRIKMSLAPQKRIKLLGLHQDTGNFARNVYVPNNAKIVNKFNLSEWTSLDEGVKKMAQVLS